MSVSGLIFRGNVNGPGEWYGKIEQQGDNKALVLFKRTEARTAAQKITDKLLGIHKAGKLASEVVALQSVEVLGKMQDPKKQLLLSRYMQSSVQNDHTLNHVAELISTEPTKSVDGSVNMLAKLTSHAGVISRQISLRWEPDPQ